MEPHRTRFPRFPGQEKWPELAPLKRWDTSGVVTVKLCLKRSAFSKSLRIQWNQNWNLTDIKLKCKELFERDTVFQVEVGSDFNFTTFSSTPARPWIWHVTWVTSPRYSNTFDSSQHSCWFQLNTAYWLSYSFYSFWQSQFLDPSESIRVLSIAFPFSLLRDVKKWLRPCYIHLICSYLF